MARPKPAFKWDELDGLVPPAMHMGQPEGTFTAQEYGERYGLATNTASAALRKLVATGKLEREAFMTHDKRKSFAFRIKK